MTTAAGRHEAPATEPGGRARAAANARLILSGVALGCYLIAAGSGLVLAADEAATGTPLIITGAAGAAASLGILFANLMARAKANPGPAPRVLTIGGLVALAFSAVSLVGLFLFHVAVGELSTALLALGCIVPLLGVTLPGVPTLMATRPY